MMQKMQPSLFSRAIRPLIVCALATIVLVAITGCLQTVFDTELLGRLSGTGLMVLLFLALIIGADVTCARSVMARLFVLPAAVLVLVGTLAIIFIIWFEDQLSHRQEEQVMLAGSAALVFSGTVVHTGVFAILPKNRIFLRICKIITVSALWVFSLFLTSLLSAPEFFEEYIFDNLDATFLGWMIIIGVVLCFFIAASGTLTVPLISILMARKQYRSEWLRSGITITLACPNCEHRQTLRRGANRCANCQKTIRVDLREPRCECGYLLFELTGSTCPECGRTVPFAISQGTSVPPVNTPNAHP